MGCYGPFTRRFGNGASNILQAKVVLANGTLVIANKCLHPDLFWSIRGGGGGVAGVVTEFVVRTHPTPTFITNAEFNGQATSVAEYKLLMKEVLQVAAVIMGNDNFDDGFMSIGVPSEGVYHVSISIIGYEGNKTQQAELLQPLLNFVRARAGGLNGSVHVGGWNATEYNPKSPSFPWMEKHPDREISTALLASMSRYFPRHYLMTEVGRDRLTDSLTNIIEELASLSVPAKTVGVMFAKGQAGLNPAMQALFNETSQNPVLSDAVGTLLIMYNIPSLPQLPPSCKLLKTLWPRLQQYAITSKDDPLHAVCTDGAGTNETAAKACLDAWYARIPKIQATLDNVRKVLWAALPNTDADGKPFSGSYWNEGDYDDIDFQLSHWGQIQYKKLLQVKATYDPSGLFICHHCVGSEFWTKESNLNCRATVTPGRVSSSSAMVLGRQHWAADEWPKTGVHWV